MAALSVFKPAEPQGETEPLSAEALLGAATKKSARSSSHLKYAGTNIEAAARWLVLGRQAEEIERELALHRDTILGVVTPWHDETCARRRAENLSVQRIGERKSLPVTVIENALHHRATANSCNRSPTEDRRACRRIAATL